VKSVQLNDLRKLAQEKIEALDIKDVQYRNDIGRRALHDIPQQLKEVANGD
jgi:phosphoribosylamine-glycine ligase